MAHASEVSTDQLAQATLCLLNVERARRGMGRLKLNRRLTAASTRHSEDMVRNGYFAHDSQSGASFVDRIRSTGYLRRARSWSVGENLAWGESSRSTPQSIVHSWMDSPPHRANVLNRRFREIGIGVVEGSPRSHGNAATYTTDFGARS